MTDAAPTKNDIWACPSITDHNSVPQRNALALRSCRRSVLWPSRPGLLIFGRSRRASGEIEGLYDITGEVSRTGIYFLCSNTLLLYTAQSVNASGRILNTAG
jgi:hypothetical protein